MRIFAHIIHPYIDSESSSPPTMRIGGGFLLSKNNCKKYCKIFASLKKSLYICSTNKNKQQMKTYIVRFSKEVCRKYVGDRFNKEAKKWEEGECEEWASCFELSSLREAKQLIKDNIDAYIGSAIYKTWADGDFENLDEIKMSGVNKTYTANTRQRISNY